MMLKYFAPSAMTAGSFESRLRIWVRPAEYEDEQQHCERAAEAQRHTDDVRNGLELFPAPVLRAHNDRALARADDQHLEQELDLVAQTDAAHRVLAVTSEQSVSIMLTP